MALHGGNRPAEALIAVARGYLGVPWQHQGRSRHGIDCVGLLVCAAHDLGIPVEDMRAYEREPRAHDLACLLRRHCVSVRVARPGDIVLMGRPSTHVGILTDAHRPFGLIHVPTNGACVEVRFDPEIHRLRGLYRTLAT